MESFSKIESFGIRKGEVIDIVSSFFSSDHYFFNFLISIWGVSDISSDVLVSSFVYNPNLPLVRDLIGGKRVSLSGLKGYIIGIKFGISAPGLCLPDGSFKIIRAGLRKNDYPFKIKRAISGFSPLRVDVVPVRSWGLCVNDLYKCVDTSTLFHMKGHSFISETLKEAGIK